MPEKEIDFHLKQFYRFLEENNYRFSENLGIKIRNLGAFTSFKLVTWMQSSNISAS